MQLVLGALAFINAHGTANDADGFAGLVIDDPVAVPDPEIMAVFMTDPIFIWALISMPRNGLIDALLNHRHVLGVNLLRPPIAVRWQFFNSPAEKLSNANG